MCGICGFVGTFQPPAMEVIEAMTRPLTPRGPDDQGIWIGDGAALGMRRLAIVDVAGGRQPVMNEDETIVAICNGEIYNHLELRSGLEARGHRMRSGSDAEVIPHLYEEHGPDFVQQLNGMFAIALWDQRARRLLLARDRMGQKPLYWAPVGHGIAFASEIKSLLQHPEVHGTLDLKGLCCYLAYEYLPAPWTIFHRVYKLRRSHILVWEAGRVRSQCYDDLWTGDTVPPACPREAAEQLWTLLQQSVERRLMSDVPLGAFLSGGIDSAAVVAAMRAVAPGGRVATFTIGFTDPSFDESRWARLVAQHFATEHHERTFDVRELLELLPQVAAYLDEPFGDPSVLPTHLLSRFAREHVTVCLAGDGGDELLAGYPTFHAHRWGKWLGRLPRWMRATLERLADALLPVSHANFSTDFVVRQFLRGLHPHPAIMHLWWLGSFRLPDRLQLLRPDVRRELAVDVPEREVQELFHRLPPIKDSLNRLLALYQETYLAEDILTKADRASMATSLEVRAPFLDPTLVRWVNALPGRWKLRGRTTKWILKEALRGTVPEAVLKRGKKGFGIPVARWLCHELKDLAAELLSPERLRRQGLFCPDYVNRMLHAHWNRLGNYRKPLWTLIMFQLWWDQYGR